MTIALIHDPITFACIMFGILAFIMIAIYAMGDD